jgi:hypothetical protein
MTGIVTVFANKYAVSWPERHADKPATRGVGLVERMTLTDAMARVFDTDAHMIACAVDPPLRPNRDALGRLPITMTALVFDVDDPVAHADGVPARSEWREGEQPKIERLIAAEPGVLVYGTRGGYRAVGRLAPMAFT